MSEQEKKRIEELKRLNEKLAFEVAERRKAEEEAHESRRMADEATQLKSDFLSNISHELRTPMHGILSFSRFGMQKVKHAPRERLANYFEQINTSANRLMHLLNDLLDLNKHVAAKHEYFFMPVSLLDIINGVSLEYNAWIREKNLHLHLKKPPFAPVAECDPDKIRQVISNLLVNAIKYSGSGKRLVYSFSQAALKNAKTETPALKVQLVDQGIGIPEEELTDVFEKFFQSTRSRLGTGGTGLGLAICKQIIEAHSGIINVTNNPDGVGCTFSFTIPLKQKKDHHG